MNECQEIRLLSIVILFSKAEMELLVNYLEINSGPEGLSVKGTVV